MKKRISLILIGFSLSFWAVRAWAELTESEMITDPVTVRTLRTTASIGDEFTLLKAKALMDKRKWPEAVAVLRHLLRNDPGSVQVIANLAMSLTYSGSREGALDVLNEGLNHVRKNERIHLVRRLCVLSRLFLTNKTFQTYQDGLNLMMGKKYRAARERFEKALVEEPDNVEVLARVGQSYLMDEDPEKAIRNLKEALRLNPFQPEIRLWLGRAFFQMNKPSDAVAELTLAHNELKDSELATVWLTDALAAAGQAASAIRLLDQDLKHRPLHVLSLIAVARLRFQAGHLDSTALWAARKELQLAMSRLDQYSGTDFNGYAGELGVDMSRAPADIKADIIRLQQQVEARIGQVSDQR